MCLSCVYQKADVSLELKTTVEVKKYVVDDYLVEIVCMVGAVDSIISA